MAPKGPYISPWTTGTWWLVSTIHQGAIAYAVVQNGQQAHNGVICPSLRDGYTHLRDNGFTLKGKEG